MGKRKATKKQTGLWIHVDLKTPYSIKSQAAGFIEENLYCIDSVVDVQTFTDEGLINLIGAGIRDAFTDAADDAEGSAEA